MDIIFLYIIMLSLRQGKSLTAVLSATQTAGMATVVYMCSKQKKINQPKIILTFLIHSGNNSAKI